MAFLQSHATHGARQVYTGEIGIKRTRYALQLMNNPQEQMKVIHIAGTSGKGSTAYFVSDLLEAHGFTTGLNVSPHIVDIRERFQIHRQFILKEELVTYLNELIPYFEQTAQTPYGYPTYFEILTLLSFHIFHSKRVDYAVMETGMGGLLDATNSVYREDKVVVLTSIGYDHVNVLGKSLPEIAANKAGIIQKKNTVIAATPRDEVRAVFSRFAKKAETTIDYVTANENYTVQDQSQTSITFNLSWYEFQIHDIKLPTPAVFQVQNAAVALVTLCTLSKRDGFVLDELKLKTKLLHFKVPARMEFFHLKKTKIIADGAHNEQKMQSFVHSIQLSFPGEKFDLLIAFKASKDIHTLITLLKPIAHHITVTSFFHLDKQFTFLSAKPDEVATVIRDSGCSDVNVIETPEKALDEVLKRSDKNIIITGSFYLIAELYDKLQQLSVDNTTFI